MASSAAGPIINTAPAASPSSLNSEMSVVGSPQLSEISFEDADLPTNYADSALGDEVRSVADDDPVPRNAAKFHPRYPDHHRTVVFQAEDTLFRVHALVFVRDSPFFRELLAGEGDAGGAAGDFAHEHQTLIRLADDVTSVAFERLLAILYPQEFGTHALSTAAEWASVLALASRWDFESVRALAIRALLPLAAPAERVVLARTHGVDAWLTGALAALVARAEPLSAAEAERLPKEDVLRIFLAREWARAASGGGAVSEKVAAAAVARFYDQRAEGKDAEPVPTSVESALALCYSPDSTGGSGKESSNLAKLAAYVAGPAFDAGAFHKLLAAIIRRVPGWRHTSFVACCTIRAHIGSRVEGRAGPLHQLMNGRTLFDHVLQERCQELLCTWHYTPPEAARGAQALREQREAARFVAQAAREGLVSEETLGLCHDYLRRLDTRADAASVARLCALLADLDAALDRGGYLEFVNAVFARLRRLAADPEYREVHNDIHDLVTLRRKRWKV